MAENYNWLTTFTGILSNRILRIICPNDIEELHSLYYSRSTIRMIKSRRMRWAGHEAQIGRRMHIGLGWKARRKQTNKKTLMWVGG
jgi:hypothetical protein